MSQLFNNYKHDSLTIPDNEKVFIKKQKEFKDVIVLGGTNKHTFSVPYTKDEIQSFSITYVQGTETKLTKRFNCNFFDEEEQINNITTYIYNWLDPVDPSTYGSKLIQVVAEDGCAPFKDESEEDDFNLVSAYCAIFYIISPEESLLFNDWNREVYVQLKADIKVNDDHSVEYSRRFKIKILKTLKEKE